MSLEQEKFEVAGESDLRRALEVLRRSWVWLAAVPVVVAVAVYVLSAQQTEYFTATAEVRVRNTSSESIFGNQQSGGDPRREIETQVRVLRSQRIRRDLRDKLGQQDRQVKEITVDAISETDVIAISVISRSASLSAFAANLLASIYVDARKSTAESALRNQADELRSKAEDISGQIESTERDLADARSRAEEDPAAREEVDRLSSERLALVDQLNSFRLKAVELDVEADARSGAVEVVDPAEPPTSPSEPTPIPNALLAALLAILATVAVALGVSRMDDRLHDGDDLDRVRGRTPIIGRLPELGRGKANRGNGAGLVRPGSPDSEAFRRLRSAVWFLSIRGEAHSIVITSANPSEGKSTVAANLAVALAASGARVALVSADLRKPTLGQFFGVDDRAVGLTSVLLGDASLADAIIPIADRGNLQFLPAGPEGFDPGVLLGSPAMADVLKQLRADGSDIILIDTAPVGPVGDAVDLAQNADGVLLIVRAGVSKKRQLVSLLDALSSAASPVLGFVMNRDPMLHRRSGYGYGYGYGVAQEDLPVSGTSGSRFDRS